MDIPYAQVTYVHSAFFVSVNNNHSNLNFYG